MAMRRAVAMASTRARRHPPASARTRPRGRAGREWRGRGGWSRGSLRHGALSCLFEWCSAKPRPRGRENRVAAVMLRRCILYVSERRIGSKGALARHRLRRHFNNPVNGLGVSPPRSFRSLRRSKKRDARWQAKNRSYPAWQGATPSALFELASEAERHRRRQRRSRPFRRASSTDSADLQRLVRSPVFSSEEQTKAITAVLAKAGIGGLAANFIKLAAQNRRLFAIRRHDPRLSRRWSPRRAARRRPR